MALSVENLDEKKFSDELDRLMPDETGDNSPAPDQVPPREATPATDTPVEKSPTEPSADQTPAPRQEDTPTTATPNETQQPPTQESTMPAGEKLFAGKYKSEADFEKGLREIGKELGQPEKLLDRYINLAKKTQDWSDAEGLYSELRMELSQRPPEETVEIPQRSEDVIPPSQEGKTLQAEINESAAALALEDMAATVEGELIVQNGYEIPKDWMELRALMKEPGMYEIAKTFFVNLMTKAQEYANEARSFSQAVQEFPEHNRKVSESSEKQIIGYFKEKHKVDLPAEDAKAMLADALRDPANYDFYYNGKVAMLKDDGPLKWVKANRLDDYLEKIQTVRDAAARAEGAADILKLQRQIPGSLSNSGRAPTRVQKREVNAADPRDVELMSDMDQERKLDELLEKLA